MRACLAAFFLFGATAEFAQQHLSFPTADGGAVFADLYGRGPRGVVLVHGGRFNRSSWAPQARALVETGFRVLAIDLRVYGRFRDGTLAPQGGDGHREDVLAAVRYLRKNGAKTVSIVGGSMGGDAGAEAAAAAEPGEIDRLVMIASGGIAAPEKIKGRKLYITARDDLGPGDVPRLVNIRKQFVRAPEPKELVILDGNAHAQFVFATDQGERLMSEILRFLTAP